MSYILEALRKSERQRRANNELPLARLADEVPRSSHRRPLVITLSVLANIGLLVYLLMPLGSSHRNGNAVNPKAVETNTAARLPPDEHGPAAADRNARSSGDGARVLEEVPKVPARPRQGSAQKIGPLPRTKREPAGTVPDGDLAKPAGPSPQRLNRTPSPSVQRPRIEAPRRDASVEIDEAAGAGLPKPKINVYAYSNRNDADRFVIISNRKYREGDRIEDGGATVKRIEEHAMTLEYDGRTYKVPRP